jgi:serine protease Do
LESLARRYGERWTPEARAYRIAGPAVVSVQSFRKPRRLNGNLGGTPVGTPLSQGTGIVIDADGFVVTNAHVIAPDENQDLALLECWLRFSDDFGGRQVRAEVLSLDREWDLGLLRILDEGPFLALPLATEDDPLIGERVMAIGSPYGTNLSLTAGLLSGIGRNIRVQGVKAGERSVRTLTGLLQTDVAINPGNSGGPLLNIHGQLIGICTASLTSAEGIAYAIPSSRVRAILEQRLLQARVWHGIQLRAASLIIEKLHPRGPAARAGLLEGDVVTSLDGQPVADPAAWQRALVMRRPGDAVTLGYRRTGNVNATARFVLADVLARGTVGVLGFAAEREYLKIPSAIGESVDMALLRVREVFSGSGADALGLTPGDTIVAVHLDNNTNGDGWVPVSTQEQLLALIEGPDFDFESLNLWWVKSDGSSLKGRLTFDDPALRYSSS